ncbi:MAG: acyclic terpene utilization AtuA family protein [Burkholderiaceae bacterium]
MTKPQSSALTIGCGAGFSADRLEPAVALAESGLVSYLVFECVGERTLAFGHRDRILNPEAGFNPLLIPRLRALLPVCRRTGTRIVTNMGVANPKGAAVAAQSLARSLGLKGISIAYVEGDEITDRLSADQPLPEIGSTVGGVGQTVVGANVYLGVEHLLPAIQSGADLVIVGRFADPSLFLAPAIAHYGWAQDDWQTMGRGTAVGHLLECGMQITGGYFADPPYKTTPNLAHCGFPMAEITSDGRCVLTKLPQAGGAVTIQTVKEQLLYEVQNPAAYLTPDVTADFSGAQLSELGPNRIAVDGITGRERPETLKVTVGFDGGYQGEAGISYAGPGAATRAMLAREILADRINNLHKCRGRLRLDLIGMASLHATAHPARHPESTDVRVHVAFASHEREQVELVMWEVESLLCCGPAGGGGFRGQIVPKVVTHSAFIGRDQVCARTTVLES